MKIFVPCRHTLGDVLAGYFCPINYGRPNPKAQLLMRLQNACRAGGCESAFVISHFDFWPDIGFSLTVRASTSFQNPLPNNGWECDELEGHQNLLRPPARLFDFPADPPLSLPIRRPSFLLPRDYILFSDGAGLLDRALDDRRIVDWLQTFLPVIRIGSTKRHHQLPMGVHGSTAAALDLADQTQLTEVFWLARHARLIVSPCTYLRTMSALFGTPVIELLQPSRAQRKTVARTVREYCGFGYGMKPGERNFWCFWNGRPSAEAERYVSGLISQDRHELANTSAFGNAASGA